MADFLTVGSTARIAWDNCLKARQAAALLVAQVATQGDFASRWQAIEKDADLLAQVIANNGTLNLMTVMMPSQAYDTAMALHARYFSIAGEAANILGVPNTVPPPVNVEGVVVRTATAVTGSLLSLVIAGFAGYFLYKWATKEEGYPRHLAPRYAGGRRRL